MLPRFAAAVQKNDAERIRQIKERMEEYRCNPDEFNLDELAKEVMQIANRPLLTREDQEIAENMKAYWIESASGAER